MGDSEKLVALMRQQEEIQKEITVLQEKIVQEKQDGISLRRIDEAAKKNAFWGHIIQEMDETLAGAYCTCLLGATDIIEDIDTKIIQYGFVAKIYHSQYQKEFLENAIRDAKLISANSLKNFVESLTDKQKKAFMLDLLMLITLPKDLDDRQMNYWSEIYTALDLPEEDIKKYIGIVQDIFAENDAKLFCDLGGMPVEIIRGYLHIGREVCVIDHEEQLQQGKGKVVILVGETIDRKGQMWNVDEYEAESITFAACTFQHVSGILIKSTKYVCVQNCHAQVNYFDGTMKNKDQIINREVRGGAQKRNPNIIDLCHYEITEFFSSLVKNEEIENIIKMYDIITKMLVETESPLKVVKEEEEFDKQCVNVIWDFLHCYTAAPNLTYKSYNPIEIILPPSEQNPCADRLIWNAFRKDNRYANAHDPFFESVGAWDAYTLVNCSSLDLKGAKEFIEGCRKHRAKWESLNPRYHFLHSILFSFIIDNNAYCKGISAISEYLVLMGVTVDELNDFVKAVERFCKKGNVGNPRDYQTPAARSFYDKD